MRFRVTLEAKTQTPDGGGGFSESWSPLATVFAAVKPLEGRETMSGGQIAAAQAIRVRIRHRDDVTPALRLLFKGRIHGIDWVRDPTGKRRWLELGCTQSRPS